MNPKKIGGIVLVLAGLFVAYTGYELSQSIGNQIQSAFKGSPTDSVVLRYVLGAALVAVGGFLAK